MNGPKLILADEPTASLDRELGQQVMGLFAALASEGSAVVLVTHDKRITDQADRILMMEEGQLVPAADRIMKDASANLRTLQDMDPARLGKMMSFGHALSQALAWEKTSATPEGRSEVAAALEALAAADDVVTDEERAVIRELLETP